MSTAMRFAVAALALSLTSPAAAQRRTTARGAAGDVDRLRRDIEDVLKREVFAPAIVAIDIRDLDTGAVLFEKNATTNVKPASTMKLFTTAAILDAEGPNSERAAHALAVSEALDAEGIEWRPEATTIETAGRLDSFGRILGDVYLVGRGDPNISDRLDWRGSKNPFDRLAADLKELGVRRIEGRLIGLDALFSDETVPDGWTADDLVWSYGAEISGLSAFDNTIRLRLEPGEREGDPGRLTEIPESAFLRIENRTITGAESSTQNLSLKRALGARTVVLDGFLPKSGKPWEGEVAAPEPALFAATLLAEALDRQGITIGGAVEARREALPRDVRPLASIRGPGVAEQIRVINKESQNLHAETLLRRYGLATAGNASVDASLKARSDFLKRLGVRAETNAMYDGSGLSRSDLVTARSLVDLLHAMSRHRDAKSFRESLPISGVDGTLRRRMTETSARNRVFAKTGSLSHVNALAGYVDAVSGRRLVFAIVVNHHSRPSREATQGMDEICRLMVEFK